MENLKELNLEELSSRELEKISGGDVLLAICIIAFIGGLIWGHKDNPGFAG